jgi:hypothetical protein
MQQAEENRRTTVFIRLYSSVGNNQASVTKDLKELTLHGRNVCTLHKVLMLADLFLELVQGNFLILCNSEGEQSGLFLTARDAPITSVI